MMTLWSKVKGGRLRSPFTAHNLSQRFAGHGRGPLACLTYALCLGGLLLIPRLVVGAETLLQYKRPRVTRQAARPAWQPAERASARSPLLEPRQGLLARGEGRAPQDPEAVELLQKMIHPTADYSGEQVTELGRGGQSQQKIIGDTRGRVRRDFQAPPALEGDVMISGPNQYRYYHKGTNTQDVAFWPTKWNEKEKTFVAAIRRGAISVTRIGAGVVANRNAVIVLLSAEKPGGVLGGVQVKYWIDPDTGIQLQTETSRANGQIISRSWLTTLSIAPVDPKAFAIGFPNALINPLFPLQQFKTLEDAQPDLPFPPLEPANIPAGFQLRGVWVFGPGPKQPGKGAVLLRYTDGVATFSLHERRVGPPANANAYLVPRKMYTRGIQRWRLSAPSSDIEVLYMGHLSPEQARSIHDSLH